MASKILLVSGTAVVLGLCGFFLIPLMTTPENVGARNLANLCAVALVLPGIAVSALALAIGWGKGNRTRANNP